MIFTNQDKCTFRKDKIKIPILTFKFLVLCHTQASFHLQKQYPFSFWKLRVNNIQLYPPPPILL